MPVVAHTYNPRTWENQKFKNSKLILNYKRKFKANVKATWDHWGGGEGKKKQLVQTFSFQVRFVPSSHEK